MAKAQRKKVAQTTPRPQRYAGARRLLLELLYLYCVSTGVAAIFAFVHHLTGLDRPVVLWGCAEVFFFLYNRWRYLQLHANPVPNDVLVADDDHFKDFLSLHCSIDFRDFISGWFFHKDFSEIRKGNVFDFVAYAFLYKRRCDLTPREAQRVNKWVDAIQTTYNIRFKEGYNRSLDFMAHIFHPLQVIHKPLIWHIISEVLGAIPHAVLWIWGFHHHFHRSFSFWISDDHAVCSLPLVVPVPVAEAGAGDGAQQETELIGCTSDQNAGGGGSAGGGCDCSSCCSASSSSKQATPTCCQSRRGGSAGSCGKGGRCIVNKGQSTVGSRCCTGSGCGCCSGGIGGGTSRSGAHSTVSSLRDDSSHRLGIHRSLSAVSFAELALKYTPSLTPTLAHVSFPSSLPNLPSFSGLPCLPNLPSVSLPLNLPSWADLPTVSLPSFPSSLLPSLPKDLSSLPSLPSFSSLPHLPSLSVPDLPVDLSFLPTLPMDIQNFTYPYLPLELPGLPNLPPWATLPHIPLSNLTKDIPYLQSFALLRNVSSLDLPSLSSLQSLAPWAPRPPSRSPPPDALPIVFIHGVGFGILPYLLFLRAIMKANPSRPVILLEVRQVALRYCHSTVDFSTMADAIVDMLKAHGYTKGCFVAHSFGTFVVSRICHMHPQVVHSTMLIDPVSMLLCFPKTVHNFLYSPPNLSMLLRKPVRAVVDVLRWFCARDLSIAQTFCRGFHWHTLSLWPRQMRRNKSLVVLSGDDDLVPSQQIKDYLQHHGNGVRLMHLPGHFHGMFLLVPRCQKRLIKALCEMLST